MGGAYLYPAEVQVARAALDLVADERGVRLPDVEAVPLALHLVNAQFDTGDIATTAQMTQTLHRVLAIIREEYGVEIDEGSVEVARFVTHLRYLFLREQQGRKLRETQAELHNALRSARPREYTSAGRIGTLLADEYGSTSAPTKYSIWHFMSAGWWMRPSPPRPPRKEHRHDAGPAAALRGRRARQRRRAHPLLGPAALRTARPGSIVDERRIESLDEVAIAVHQRSQYQVALRRNLLETFDELTVLLRR